MGLLYALKQLSQGNFENAFNGAFVSDDLLAAQDQAGDTLTKKIQSQAAAGLIDSTQAQAMYSQLSPNTSSTDYWTQSGDSPLTVFNNTLSEEASNIGQFGSKAINRIAGLGFRIIPWQVYVLLLILAMVWLYPIWKPFAAKLFAGNK